MKTYFILLLFGISLSACKKKKNDEPFSGTVTTISPNVGDTIHGSQFTLQASGNANKELHGWYCVVYNATTLDVIHENQAHDHANTLTINEQVSCSLTDTTVLKIVYEFATDHVGENLKKEFNCIWVP